MQWKKARIVLICIETGIGLSALAGGIALLTGTFDQWLPITFLQGTPFKDYTCPGLILTVGIGGGMLLAAISLLLSAPWSELFSAAMGVIMVGFEMGEVLIIDRYQQAAVPGTIMQQLLFTGLGMLTASLAASLWLANHHYHNALT